MSALYTLPDAPPIPGLRFRPFAGASDADALLYVHTSRAEHDGVDPLSTSESISTREEFIQSLAAMTEAGTADRTILAEIGDEVVGYNRFFDWTEADDTHVWLTVGWVVPAWRGRGLGTALLQWTERRMRELAAAQGDRWEFAGNASSTEVEATALLRDNGYQPAYTVLEMGLEWDLFSRAETEFSGKNPVSRPDITIRPGQVEQAAAIAASVNESYRDEYDGGRYAERFDPVAYAEELAGADYDPSLWRVAWDGDEVAGQVIPLIERGRAEIYEVSVRPGWRRHGIARALMVDALRELRRREVAVVRLHTVAEFPTRAVELYEKLGFNPLKLFPRYRKTS
jgi:GNAT superfamily N-acetyltransferase